MAKGSTTYYDDARKAARQASLDLAAFMKAPDPVAEVEPDAPNRTWQAVGSIGSMLGGIGGLLTAGVNIANLVLSQSTVPANDALEIQVVNNTSVPVVPFSWSANEGDIARVPAPLVPSDSDLLLLTNTDGGFDDTTAVTLDMLVGTGDTAVELAVKYDFTENERWRVSAGLDTDGSPDHEYDKDLEIAGASFVADAGTTYPSFSLYTATTQSTGAISLVLYDYAPPLVP